VESTAVSEKYFPPGDVPENVFTTGFSFIPKKLAVCPSGNCHNCVLVEALTYWVPPPTKLADRLPPVRKPA
jgi:hypothetical protein